MPVERISYRAGDKTFNGALVYADSVKTPKPLLLMAPNWLGVTEHAIQRTQDMVGDRYIGFVADMYGDGKVAAGPPEAAPLANALRADAPERRQRIAAALDVLTRESGKRGIGNAAQAAAVGFCFGGGNVLELARTGADIKAAVCLHGDLLTPVPAKAGDIKAALFILHGAKDPVVPKEHRDSIEAELEAAGAKWQMLTFGHLLHSFSEHESDVPGIAQYDPGAAQQCHRMLDDFIADAFAGRL